MAWGGGSEVNVSGRRVEFCRPGVLQPGTVIMCEEPMK